MSDNSDAEKKYFRWYDLERIAAKTAADPALTESEYLAYLRTLHVFILGFRSVRRQATIQFNILPFSRLGAAEWTFISGAIEALMQTAEVYPQNYIEALLRLIEEPLASVSLQRR